MIIKMICVFGLFALTTGALAVSSMKMAMCQQSAKHANKHKAAPKLYADNNSVCGTDPYLCLNTNENDKMA